ncbi:sugar phosphate isomerase/epimerase [Tessaracoccus rhinocerotis]|uniref:Sugar phosphate isomerase/epimerase n=1 Tax=Tessaracoccus rhinocerotis TaxID=1689449 RepID=A0A553JYX6_9ACTN|nr:sugar phosphate isomerase/epimerase family protein [Tessaracoccus rhinocerotis]TRY17660.1 sugar phosphate isomerase/epimerase [Tessaracoccus rhinocerotis]
MKKGINYWSFAEGTTASQAIDLAAAAGFSGLEFCLAEAGDVALDSSDAELARVRQRAADAGVELPSLASWLVWENNLVSDDAAVRGRAREIIRRQIDVAHALGAGTVLVVPGYVGVDFVSPSEVVAYDAAWDRALEAISELAIHAEQAEVRIGVENVWNKFLLSPLEMRAFVDSVGHPSVGVYFDIGNALLTGYPEQWIRILGERIVAVHVKDYRRSPGGFDSFVDLLAGDVDFPAVNRALLDTGYAGYVSAEMMPPYRFHTDQLIHNTSASMDRIFDWSTPTTHQEEQP